MNVGGFEVAIVLMIVVVVCVFVYDLLSLPGAQGEENDG